MRNLLIGCVLLVMGCASQELIEVGTYVATPNIENMDAEVRAYTATTNIKFGFEADHTFIYDVSAMGQEKKDKGKWEIKGDSLYIHSLERGPDSVFKIIKNDDGSIDIIGPNHFRLTPEEKIAPPKK